MAKYRIEAGYPARIVLIVDTDGKAMITAATDAPGFVGQPLHKLEWWLTAKCSPVSKTELPVLAEVMLPKHCGCNVLLQTQEQLERHVEKGCWR